jgi:hypothetical protein
MLEAHDGVLKKANGEGTGMSQTDGAPNGYDTTITERPEKLTRVRLVQFHKNPNEPMVMTYTNLRVDFA